MNAKVEILPPVKKLPVPREDGISTIAPPPVPYYGGPIKSAFTRRAANRDARAIRALTDRTNAQNGLLRAQTYALESYAERERAVHKLQELAEILATDRAVRRIERAQRLAEALHEYEISEIKRQNAVVKEQTAVTHSKVEHTHARTALLDAEQQLRAQKEHGYFNYVLIHKRRTAELLELQLSEAERLALYKKSMREMRHEKRSHHEDDGEIDDALYARREQLEAAGLDTDRIDAVIKRRKKK